MTLTILVYSVVSSPLKTHLPSLYSFYFVLNIGI
jgi:hypothetical protein